MPLPYNPEKLHGPFPEAVAHIAQVMGEHLEDEISVASGPDFAPARLHEAGVYLGSAITFGTIRAEDYSKPVPAPMFGADAIGFRAVVVPHETVRNYGLAQANRLPQRIVRFALYGDGQFPRAIGRYQMFVAPHLPPALLDYDVVHRVTRGRTDDIESAVAAVSACYDPPGPAELDKDMQRTFISALVASDNQLSIKAAKQKVYEAYRERLGHGY